MLLGYDNNMRWPVWSCVIKGEDIIGLFNYLDLNLLRDDQVTIDVITCIRRHEPSIPGSYGGVVSLYTTLD
jgi:hypothetical protein